MTTPKIGGMYFLLLLTILFNFSCNHTLVSESGWQLVGSGFSFPEGPAWDGKKTLYVSNCYGGWIAGITNSKIDTLASASDTTFQRTNGLAIGKDGHILACEFGAGAILQISALGKVSVLVSGYAGEPFHRPNDLVIDREGNIYFTDPNSYGKEKNDGRIFYYDMSTSDLTLAGDSLAFPNGIAISPIDGKLYVCESAKNQISHFEITEQSILKNKEVFIVLPGGDPDGIAFDVKGNLYVAHFGGGTVYIISPEGQILEQIKTPGIKPTNLEFGDTDLKTLYLTEVETNSLFKIRVKYPGFKSF
jgi:gluconolactonase